MDIEVDYIPDDSDERREWIKYQLKIRGLTLASLAREHGVSRHVFSKALTHGSIRWDHVIAKAINFPVSFLWPDRYDADNLPRKH